MRVIFGIFPLLFIPVIIYNLMAFGFGAGHDGQTMAQTLASPIWTIPMVAPGSQWQISSGDLLVIVSLGFFFIEILKSTSTGAATIANHGVSMLVFIVALVEFLLLKNFSTSAYFILTMMCLLDVLAGVVVTIISARRDFTVAEGLGGHN
ncbi:MAG: hypothetical protein GC155_11300 [Alphaproteobacteria bacterium]|nr:hypothetical protein [Alphaproteobacteria bacterium]